MQWWILPFMVQLKFLFYGLKKNFFSFCKWAQNAPKSCYHRHYLIQHTKEKKVLEKIAVVKYPFKTLEFINIALKAVWSLRINTAIIQITTMNI